MHHGEALRAATRDDLLVYHVQRDWTRAPLDVAERAMLRFAEKLNREPSRIVEADVQALREAGFDDRGVVDIVLVVALFNFMNRIADGLGFGPDEKFVRNRERHEALVLESLRGAGSSAAG